MEVVSWIAQAPKWAWALLAIALLFGGSGSVSAVATAFRPSAPVPAEMTATVDSVRVDVAALKSRDADILARMEAAEKLATSRHNQLRDDAEALHRDVAATQRTVDALCDADRICRRRLRP